MKSIILKTGRLSVQCLEQWKEAAFTRKEIPNMIDKVYVWCKGSIVGWFTVKEKYDCLTIKLWNYYYLWGDNKASYPITIKDYFEVKPFDLHMAIPDIKPFGEHIQLTDVQSKILEILTKKHSL